MKYVLTLFMLFSFALISNAQNKDEAAIRQLMKEQENAWNEGNLEKFMAGYWHSDSLMFIGKKGPTYGYDQTLNNYKKGYPDTAHMGHFTSAIISVQKLSNDYYFVVGKWDLQRSVGNINGHYTLLFRKLKGKWVIVADHSS